MLTTPMDILTAYPVRKSKKQRQAFREDVQALVKGWGYETQVEKGSFGARNLIIGDPEKAEYLVTAHYDTCAWLPFPNLVTPFNFFTFMVIQMVVAAIMILGTMVLTLCAMLWTDDPVLTYDVWVLVLWTSLILMYVGPANKHNANDNTSGVVTLLEIARSLPQNQRGKVCFVLFDLEEAGLWGSASYGKKHKKQLKNQLAINLDCVGDGDEIFFFPNGRLKRKKERLAPLERAVGVYGEKSIAIHKKGFGFNPSDHINLFYGVGAVALRKNWLCRYLGRIHTGRDTVLDQTNVNLLRSAIISVIACGAAQNGKENAT